MAQLTAFALKKDALLSARRGREEWPSWAMQLAIRTGSGTMPLAYRVTKIMCGPDSQSGIAAYPAFNVYIVQSDTENGKYAECPPENDRKMSSDYVTPQMFVHEMVRCKA